MKLSIPIGARMRAQTNPLFRRLIKSALIFTIKAQRHQVLFLVVNNCVNLRKSVSDISYFSAFSFDFAQDMSAAFAAEAKSAELARRVA
jgi:hypothetical protein